MITTNRQNDNRVVSIDAMRTIALFGIIVLNYHGYLNFSGALSTTEPSIYERWWHPFNGVLANPFPVGFVMVAGMGVSLMTSTNRKDKLKRPLATHAGDGWFVGQYYMTAPLAFWRELKNRLIN